MGNSAPIFASPGDQAQAPVPLPVPTSPIFAPPMPDDADQYQINPLVRDAIHATFNGLKNLVTGPGQMMQSNPYDQYKEPEAFQSFEDSRSSGMTDWSRNAALATMGTGAIAGVPLRAGEMALGSGAVRGVKSGMRETPQELYHVVGPDYVSGDSIRSLYARKGNTAYDEYAARWPEAGDLVQYHPHQNFFYDTLEAAQNHASDFGGRILKIDPSKVDGLHFDKNEGFWTTKNDVSPESFLDLGTPGQNNRPSLDAQQTLTTPEGLTDTVASGSGMSSDEFMSALKDRLSGAGWHTYSPPNPNSLSKYLSVGKKSEFNEGVDPVVKARIRLGDHEGYGADFDFRPNSSVGNKGLYNYDLDSLTKRITDYLERLKRGSF